MSEATIQSYIDEVKTLAVSAVTDLKTAALGQIESTWNTQTSNIDAPSSDYIFSWSPPAIPEVPDITIDATYKPQTTTNATTYVWNSAGDTALKSQILAIFTNGGMGLSSALQTAIFNADLDRKLQTLNDMIDLVNSRSGAKGFRRPSSMTTAQVNELTLKHQFDQENQSREITKLVEEHARTNLQFAIQQGISLEQFQADFTYKYNTMYIEMMKASVELYRTEIAAQVSAYEAKIKGLISKVEVAKAQAGYYQTMGGVLIEKYKADVLQESSRAELIMKTAATNKSNIVGAMSNYATAATNMLQAVNNSVITLTKTTA